MPTIPYIPYFETTRYRVEAMIELTAPKQNEKVADLGAGDGRISIAFGEKGCIVSGFELDQELIRKSEEHISIQNLTQTVTMYQKDFWNTNFSAYDIIAIYPMPDIMDALEEKLQKEGTPGTRIVTNYYSFSKWKPENKLDNVYLYLR